MCSKSEQPLYGVILMILHANKSCVLISGQNLQISLSPPKKFPMLHFLSNMPAMTQRILTGPARAECLWVNDFNHNEYHIWHAWPSTCWHVGNNLPKYEVITGGSERAARVSRRMDCRIGGIEFYVSAKKWKVASNRDYMSGMWVYMLFLCGIEIDD